MKEFKVGIDDISLYVPNLYLDISDLADKRNINSNRLVDGLGVRKMALLDVHQDTATMAANCALDLISKNNINPNEIDKMYLGTESALDSSKSTAVYVMGMLEDKLSSDYGEMCFQHCDAVDMIFACIGSVDALNSAVDYVRSNPSRKAIVISSDFAKYELCSNGEYTQGAGAVAMLITKNPRLLNIEKQWGVATDNIFDFFKSRRVISKKELFDKISQVINFEDYQKDKVKELVEKNKPFLGINETNIQIFKDEPIFQGKYSNDSYQRLIKKSYFNLKKKINENLAKVWNQIIFHIPYAFHAQKIFSEIFMLEFADKKMIKEIEDELGMEYSNKNQSPNMQIDRKTNLFYKLLRKTNAYTKFVIDKIDKGQRLSSQIGNAYTASIFISFISYLQSSFNKIKIDGHRIGFISYGSGAKSKVFEGRIAKDYYDIVKRFKISDIIENRLRIDMKTYEKLHMNSLEKSILEPKNEFALVKISNEDKDLGARHYKWFN